MTLEKAERTRVPWRLEPLMWAHFFFSGDGNQHLAWRDHLESIRQADAIASADDPEERALYADKDAWQQMRITGRLATVFGLSLSTFWLAWLIPLYAIGHGFGWLAGLSFLLPIPIAWRVGTRLWERAALLGMKDMGKRPSVARRVRTAIRSLWRSFGAGFGFGFTLVFLQTLITWFMTPADTFLAELLFDAKDACVGGTLTGTMSVMLAPLVARARPQRENELLGGGSGQRLLEAEID